MKKSEVKYLLASLFCGCTSVAVIIVCFATESWITSDVAELQGSNISDIGSVNYGLFFGKYSRSFFAVEKTYQLTLTCYLDGNVCAWSCRSSGEERSEEVKQMFEEGTGNFVCDAVDSRQMQVPRLDNSTKTGKRDSSRFVNAGMWISTLTFMSLALLFATVGAGFTVLNIVSNPIETLAGIFGIYIWYGTSVFCIFLVLVLWGCEYGIRLSSNVAILDTIVNDTMFSEGLASLGYSYFLILLAECGLYVAMGLIYYRQRVLNRADSEKVISISNVENDSNAYLY